MEPHPEKPVAQPDFEPLVSGRRAWVVLGAISLSSFQTALSLSVMFVVRPELPAAFPEASTAQLSWVINAFNIVGAATLVLAGAIGERWGRKRTILLGTAAFMVASAAAALAPNVMVLIVARVVQALASVATLPAGVATLIAAFPQDKRGTAIGTWSAAGAVAAALGPLLGGFLIGFGGWQAAFWINLPLGAVAFVATWLVIPEYRLETKTKELLPDPLGSVMLAVGISAIVLAIVQIQDWQWLDVRTITIGTAGIVVVGWVLRRCRDHPSPIFDLKLFNYRSFAYGNVAMTLLAFGFFAFQLSGILFLTKVWEYDISKAGLLSTPIFAFTAVGASVGGRMIDKLGSFWVAVPGGVLWLAGLGWLALGSTTAPDAWFWLGAVSLAGVGSGLMWGGVFAMSVSDLPGHFITLGTSVIQTVMRIGTSFGVAAAETIVGAEAVLEGAEAVLESVDGFRAVFAMSAITCAVAAAFMASGYKRSPAEL